MVGSALSGVALTLAWQRCSSRLFKKHQRDPETDFSVGHELVWSNIRGALGAAMLYVGDRLELYATLRSLCHDNDGDDDTNTVGTSPRYTRGVTALELAQETGLHVRWLREWLAQQAAMGVLKLLPGTGDTDADLVYRLPTATAQVLANPESPEYDVSMVHLVPTLVHRAQVMIPEAMRTGVGWPYNAPEVSVAIDRQHARHIRHVFLPKVLPCALQGRVLQMLEQGCQVCDLGCGAGGLILVLAERFPKSTFHGFEISAVALQKATYASVSNKLRNVTWHDANTAGYTRSAILCSTLMWHSRTTFCTTAPSPRISLRARDRPPTGDGRLVTGRSTGAGIGARQFGPRASTGHVLWFFHVPVHELRFVGTKRGWIGDSGLFNSRFSKTLDARGIP